MAYISKYEELLEKFRNLNQMVEFLDSNIYKDFRSKEGEPFGVEGQFRNIMSGELFCVSKDLNAVMFFSHPIKHWIKLSPSQSEKLIKGLEMQSAQLEQGLEQSLKMKI